METATATRLAWQRIATDSYTNGPGARTVLWMTGCAIHCPGCQNRALWAPSETTKGAKPELMAKYLLGKAGDQDLTITGGEPFLQPEALARLLAEIRLLDHSAGRTGDSRRQIVVYTGYTWEDLLDLAEAIPAIAAALSLVDVLVDGPYIARLDDLFVQWRGSRNQRVIDVQASFANGALREPAYSLRGDVDGDDRLVLLDWDTPTLTLADGQLVGATGLMRELFDAKDLQPTARCGEPDR